MSHDAFGSQLGRIHMQKMDLSKLQTRKMKGLKRKAWSSDKLEQSGQSVSAAIDKPVSKKRRAADMETG